MEAAGLIVAAGLGRRMGAERPKCLLPLAGEPLFLHAWRALRAVPELRRLVLVTPPGWETEFRACLEQAGEPPPWALLPGGASRARSVQAGLAALAAHPPELVAIHDGARPLVTPRLVRETLEAAQRWGAALAAAPLVDTLKQAGEDLLVTATPPREGLWRAQTPQTFRFDLIWSAHQRDPAAAEAATDDAALLEQAGLPVRICPSPEPNLKITGPQDLARAERLLGAAPLLRVGHGYDLHRLGEGRPLVLGGVRVPHDRGLLGHSDADVACHALADALLGAAALGDLGHHFPDTDPQWSGADSLRLLAQCARLAEAEGLSPANCDVTIVAQQPRLAPYVAQMRERLAQALGCEARQVSVKATTEEGLGPVGEGAAIAAHAVVLLQGTQRRGR